MTTIVKKMVNGKEVILADDMPLSKEELKKLNRYLNAIKKRQHLCFDCGLDIAKCPKIMEDKRRLDKTGLYDFIDESYQEYTSETRDMRRFIVTKCTNYIKPSDTPKKVKNNNK